MSRDTSVAVLFALAFAMSSCGSVTPAASPLELDDGAAELAARAPDASADDTSSSQAAPRDARDGATAELASPLPTGPCAGLINPPPTTIVPCSSTCATCTSAAEAFVDCRMDGTHLCVAACSDCP